MEIGAFAGLASFLGLAVLALLSFAQGRDIRRLRDWAGSAPERDAERKEVTSEAAAERAEEIKRLEEGRTAEQEAAELRETRRERREAGMPELTRGERLRASFSGGRSRFAEPGFLVAAFLVVVLIGGGAAYALTQTGDDGGGGAKGGAKGKSASKPAETEVAVLNGTAVEGLASSFGDKVETNGYKLGVITNTSSAFEDSVVMFRSGHGGEAHRVADLLEIQRVKEMTEEVVSVAEGAPIAVVIGEDNASSAG
jgi:hypothetical protein